MLREAEREAERIIKEARNSQDMLISTRRSPSRPSAPPRTCIEDARAREREIRLGAEDYADETLNTLDGNLSKFIAAVQRRRERLRAKREPADIA